MPRLTPYELEHYEAVYEQLNKKPAGSTPRRRSRRSSGIPIDRT